MNIDTKTNPEALRRLADYIARSDDPDTTTALRWAADDIETLCAALDAAQASGADGEIVLRLPEYAVRYLKTMCERDREFLDCVTENQGGPGVSVQAAYDSLSCIESVLP